MFHDDSQFLIGELVSLVFIRDELVQPREQYTQLAISVHREDRGEAARANRDGIHDETR